MRSSRTAAFEHKVYSTYCNNINFVEAVRSRVQLHHPDSEDLAFLYGTIVTDGNDAFSDQPTINLTVFADQEVIAYLILCDISDKTSYIYFRHYYFESSDFRLDIQFSVVDLHH